MKNEGLGMDHDVTSHQCIMMMHQDSGVILPCRVINLVLHAQKKSRMLDSG
jgi:hypothetical protein